MLVRYLSSTNYPGSIRQRDVKALGIESETLGENDVVYKILDEGRIAAKALMDDACRAIITNGNKEYMDGVCVEVGGGEDILAYADSEAAASRILSEFYKAVQLGKQTFDLLQFDARPGMPGDDSSFPLFEMNIQEDE